MTRLVLHVGLPKSGTTYLQTRLVRNAVSLGAHGVLVPVAPRDQGRGSIAFRAALDLTERRMGRPQAYVDGWWTTLRQLVDAHPGPVVVSHEAFVRCTPEQAARAVADLGAHHEVEVVITARAPGRLLVSAWLEGLKHGTRHDLDEHLRLARDGLLPVWRTLDLTAVLQVWTAALPPGRVRVVTVPPRGASRTELWPRFCTAAGLPVDAAPVEPRRTNESLGVPEAQLMLALNQLVGPDVARGGRHHRRVSRVLAPALAAGSTVPVEVPEHTVDWVLQVSTAWLAWLDSHDVEVVGDAGDLVATSVADRATADPTSVHPEVARAAARALRVLLETADAPASAAPVGNVGNLVDGAG